MLGVLHPGLIHRHARVCTCLRGTKHRRSPKGMSCRAHVEVSGAICTAKLQRPRLSAPESQVSHSSPRRNRERRILARQANNLLSILLSFILLRPCLSSMGYITACTHLLTVCRVLMCACETGRLGTVPLSPPPLGAVGFLHGAGTSLGFRV